MNASAYSQTDGTSTPPPLKPGGAFPANNIQEPSNRSNAGQGWLLFQRADEAASGVYYPATLKSMRTAFDLAWENMSPMFEDQEKARQILALQILHHVDRGEHNVGRLATAAADDLITLAGASDRPQSRRRSASEKASTRRSFVAYRTLRHAT
jgi:hypothetical protein